MDKVKFATHRSEVTGNGGRGTIIDAAEPSIGAVF